MNFIIPSPHYPENFKNFAYRLADRGVNVLGLGDEPYESLGEGLKNALTDYFRVLDLEDIDEVKRAVAFLFYKYGPISGIESNNEYWLPLDASIRDQFNIPGLRPSDLEGLKYKSKMKDHFRKAGVPVIEGRLILEESDLREAIGDLGLPLVAKPDNGVGAGGTFKLEDDEDVDNFLKVWDRSIEYFVEPYIEDGILCTYDGLIDLDGDIIFETGLYHTIPTLELVRDKLDLAFIVKGSLEDKLIKYGRAIVEEFGMKGRFFHIEFFKRPNDEYVAIEYNNRVAGGYTIDVYNHCFGIDLYDIFARMVTGEKIEKIPASPNFALGLSQRSEYTYENYGPQIRESYGDRLKEEGPVPEAFRSIQGDYKYIIVTDNEDEIDHIVDFVHKHKEK